MESEEQAVMSWTMPTNNFKCCKSISRMSEERRENQSRDNYSELSGPLDIYSNHKLSQ